MRAGRAAVDLVAQAEFIKRVIKRYNVEHSGIDVTGMGDSVAQLVEKFFPKVTRYRYTSDIKLAMVRQPDPRRPTGGLPQLMGIIPNNTGCFGDIEKAAAVFVANELEPLQEALSEFNDMTGQG